MNRPIAIVGGGHAAAQLCHLLVGAGRGSDVRMISEEEHLPYQRPPLSKGFLSQHAEGLQFHKDGQWYEQNAVAMHLGVPVTRVDRSARQLHLASGSVFAYETLVLATGTRARTLAALPPHLLNVSTLRSADDAARLRATLTKLRASNEPLTILGGGFIGLEIAAVARQMGLHVLLIETAERLLSRAVSGELSEIVLRHQRDMGVHVVLGARVRDLRSDNERLVSINVNGQEQGVSHLVLAIGAAPEVSLAEAAGLQVDDGIAVGRDMRTSDPSILAIGDCTAFDYKSGRLRLESVQNASDQARAAFETIQGQAGTWNVQPWFWSDQGSLKVQMAGLLPASERRSHYRAGPSEGSGTFFHYVGDELLCVESVNAPIDHMWCKKILAAGSNPCATAIVDTGVALKTLV